MRTLKLIERQDKGPWSVSLFSDGSLTITSFHKRKVNITHSIPYYMQVQNCPRTVTRLVNKLRKGHPHYARSNQNG